MDRRLRIVQLGCGKMGKYLMRYAMENGARVVGAFDADPHKTGMDIAEFTGGERTGVTVRDAAELAEGLAALRPDCAIVATRSLLKDVADSLRVCAENGVNVVTTCDEALFPWNSSPALTAELDALAREHGCTITGAGFPDLCYCHMVAAAAGAAHKLTKIQGSASYNVDDYGIALAEHHGAGYPAEVFEREIASADRLSREERDALIARGEFKPIPMWNANGWLCARLGLTVTGQEQRCEPIFYEGELYSQTLGRTIAKGEACGMRSVAVTHTKEGIVLETESIGKVYAPGEVDTNRWVLRAEADIVLENRDIRNTEMICALMVSRVVDCVNAPAGFVTSDRMGPARYFVRPMQEYITG